MLGYVNIDKEKLNDSEKGLFQTFMCGICISTKELFGELPRNLVTNDINILSILIHSYGQIQPQMYSAKCISSPFRKRTIFTRTELFDKLAAANIILCYASIYDGTIDNPSAKKKIAKSALEKYYEKAVKILPNTAEKIKTLYAQLRELEKENSSSIDQVCECSAKMLEAVLLDMVENPDAKLVNLCYNIGKWVYLIDALDDIAKDIKRKNYNPLLAYFGETTAKEFAEKNKQELEYIFYSTLNQIATDYNDLNLQMFRCVLDNVIYHGIREKTQQVLEKYKEKK